MNHVTPEQESDSKDDFFITGGEIYEKHANGEPIRWRCGKNANDEPTDPPNVNIKDVQRYINKDGDWEGRIPKPGDIQEAEMWRTELADPDDNNNAKG